MDNYVTVYKSVTGKSFDKFEMIKQSERVYNFQRIFNLRRGYGKREHDAQPFRAAGPVTLEEYESRQDRYDSQMKETIGIDPEGKTTEEKLAITRKYREEVYEKLLDSVYERRGWTKAGVPTIDHLKSLGMDLPELIEVVKPIWVSPGVSVNYGGRADHGQRTHCSVARGHDCPDCSRGHELHLSLAGRQIGRPFNQKRKL